MVYAMRNMKLEKDCTEAFELELYAEFSESTHKVHKVKDGQRGCAGSNTQWRCRVS